jgi:hypothetical protein
MVMISTDSRRICPSLGNVQSPSLYTCVCIKKETLLIVVELASKSSVLDLGDYVDNGERLTHLQVALLKRGRKTQSYLTGDGVVEKASGPVE